MADFKSRMAMFETGGVSQVKDEAPLMKSNTSIDDKKRASVPLNVGMF
jgi:hypothetical protein